MGDLILMSVVAGVVTGFIGRYVAKEKNRSGSEGFWFGFLLSLIGVIIVALLPTREAKVAPKKVELTEEQLEDKKKRFEKAQKENTKSAITMVVISLLLMVAYVIYSKYI
jgi:drug/metabolite transporter (DMT)-like permease